ncbi:MAG: rhomboid family intramembrane serine protease, partial [Prolixibacteraceae bacterium]|nr:rhomboid family intramembrane serine protease [Prolixibacteraceae bacterium]
VLFTSIFFDPWHKLLFFGVIPIPGIVFGVLYLAYCIVMARKASDNIGHDAHFFGALFGFVFPLFIDFSLLPQFIEKIIHP